MRKSTRKAQQVESLYLPGFEPEGYVAPAAKPAVEKMLFPETAAFLPTEVAVVAKHVAAAEAPATFSILEQSTMLQALSLGADDFDVGQDVLPTQKRDWPAFALDELMPPSGELERVEENLRILQLVKSLRDSGAQPSQEQTQAILRYTGWGSIARIFEDGLDGKKLGEHQTSLRALLDEKEWASARASTPYAHYTDQGLIAAIWAMVERFGFKGGNILEPAAGTGLFLAGMPRHIAEQSQITAVELDTVSGGLLKTVFAPLGVDVHIKGLEKAKLPKGFYDLCVTNAPFGNVKVPDTSNAPYSNWNVHNWFFAKALELVRPGGLVVMITSSHTLMSTPSVRQWLNVHAELIEAVQLPEGAFRRQAKTDVVTDMVVLRKRKAPKFGDSALWAGETVQAPVEMMAPGQDLTIYNGRGYIQRERKINPWFARHPSRVLGKYQLKTNRFGVIEPTPVFTGSDEDLHAHLKDLVTSFEEGVYQEAEAKPEAMGLTMRKLIPLTETKAGQFVLHHGKLCVSEGDAWVDVDALYKGKLRSRVLGMMGMRDAARALIEYQSNNTGDADLKPLQDVLNDRYDSFVKEHGYIFEKMNVRAFKSDPDCPLVLSLEKYDSENQVGVKADIFSMRTVHNRRAAAVADSVNDALLYSLNTLGRIDVREMAHLLKWKVARVTEELVLQSLAYRDPLTKQWVTSDEYLSGNIRNKLLVAQAAGKAYEVNAKALESALPKPLGPGEICIRLGAPWVPTAVIDDFIASMMELKRVDGAHQVKAIYDASGAVWSLTSGRRNIDSIGQTELRDSKWGTQCRNFFDLVQAALNQQPPTVTTTVNGQPVVDKRRTLEAREKYEAIKARFQSWAYESPARTELLVEKYNSLFNQVVVRKWDGSHLTLPGLSDAYVPYKHQLNAVWRIVTSGNTLLAHVVGAGKSLTMMAASMELRRLAIASKPLHVVPGHMLYQYTSEFLRAYPGARVLMADKESLSGDKRREFAARIATGDWDAVVMTQPSFERIPMRPETVQRFVDEMLGKIRLALSMADDAGAKRSVKELEKRLKNLQAKLEKQVAESKRDGVVYFEDLGIDCVVYDEAHSAKNLMRISKMPRIAGLPNTASQRALDLLIKTNSLSAMLGGEERGLILSTATPLANSIGELFTFQRFLQPRTLEELGLDEFDAWAATFGEAVTGLEVAPDGSGYRVNTRFAKFVNVPELMTIFRMRADIQTRSMLNLPTPAVVGGKPRAIACSASVELKAFTKTLVERADKVRTGRVDPRVDNMLKITHEGRLAALDMRLIDPTLPAHPGGKLAKVCEEALRIYKETSSRRGTQLLFCDASTPSAVRFSVYNQLREDLVAAGIPRHEIEFIHDHDTDAAKDKLFKRVRAGLVRVLLGSTSKLGVGTNIQTLLKAVLAIDVPWRPCDVEQRFGRGLRVGNLWDEIELLAFCTEHSFDTYMYQSLECKAGFIEQIMSGDCTIRSVEDVASSPLTFAELKAISSGNPIVLEKATVDAELLKLSTLRDLWERDRWNLTSTERELKTGLEFIERTALAVPLDAELCKRVVGGEFRFTPSCDALAKAMKAEPDPERKLGAAIRRAAALAITMGDIPVGSFDGLELVMVRGYDSYVRLTLPNTGIKQYERVMVSKAAETGEQVCGFIRDAVNLVEQQAEKAKTLRERLARCQAMLSVGFEHTERIALLCARQAEIIAELDLDKDEEGAAVAEQSETEDAAEEVVQQ